MNYSSQLRALLISSSILSATVLYADWELTAEKTVSNAVVNTTNTEVRRIQDNKVRVDLSSEASMFILRGKKETIQLCHWNRTYVRTPLDLAATDTVNGSPGFKRVESESHYDGHPVRLLTFNTGFGMSRIWMAPAQLYLESTQQFGFQVSEEELVPEVAVGSLVGTNWIVVQTELTKEDGIMLLPGAENSLPTSTNLISTMTSRLVSITETNFSQEVFEIPEGYTESTESLQPGIYAGPGLEVFGPTAAGLNKFEGLRKSLNEGKSPVQVHQLAPRQAATQE